MSDSPDVSPGVWVALGAAATGFFGAVVKFGPKLLSFLERKRKAESSGYQHEEENNAEFLRDQLRRLLGAQDQRIAALEQKVAALQQALLECNQENARLRIENEALKRRN